MKCARFYEYAILKGYRSSAVDLEFGILFALALAAGRIVRARGGTRAEAQLASVRCAMLKSGAYETHDPAPYEESPHDTWVPWGGVYMTMWRCTGATKYKNEKGNAAKCPHSHKGVYAPGVGPAQCGRCGSPTETARRWLPGDTQKDRIGLVRAVAWYWEEQADDESRGLHTVLLPSGAPAVELSWRLPTGYKSSSGEDFIISGHFDAIQRLGDTDEVFITDDKTTRKTLAPSYFAGYSPDIQTDLYDLAGSILFGGVFDVKGVAIQGTQLLATGSRHLTQPLYRTEALREELLENLGFWFAQAERYAAAGHWPMNRGACWLCPFKSICSKPASERERWLDESFEKRLWNPLDSRGEDT